MTKQEREEKLKARLQEMQSFDSKYREYAVSIGGIDEVGRGPLAGPVVTSCVVLPGDFDVLGVDDSKKIPEKKREEIFKQIIEKSIAYGIGICDNDVIDEINILEATKRAMLKSIDNCNSMLEEKGLEKLGYILVDAVKLATDIPQANIIKGDATSLSIAAASIVAKVTRDRIMVDFSKEYPYYGFESNKGYGTKAHYEGISTHGITPIHRKSFLKGVKY